MRAAEYQKEEYLNLVFLRGGVMTGLGEGTSSPVLRASGSLLDVEGSSGFTGTGFTFELRGLDWAWLVNQPLTHVRFGLLTLGTRYRFVTLFHRVTERWRHATLTNSGTYQISADPIDFHTDHDYFSSGAFARFNALTGTIIGSNDTDPVTKYDPYVEGGLYTTLAYGAGLEVSVGGGYALVSGASVFVRVEVLLAIRQRWDYAVHEFTENRRTW